MKRISKAELKKAILAVEAERAKHPVAFRPDPAQHPRLEKSRRASEEMVSGFLREAGLDMEKFQALQERHSVQLERMVAKHKTDALRRAARQKDTLHSSVLGQSEAFQSLDDFFSLDTPFLIWTTPLLPTDSAAVPLGSWAKFRVTTSEYQGTPKVGFYFYWPSPFSDYAVINAATFMSATGHLKSHAPWGIWPNTSWVTATAQFGLWFGFPRDVASTSYASEFLGGTGEYGGGIFIPGDTSALSISAGVGLSKTMFAVPPGSVVVFEVALQIEYENNDGDIDADFESGDFRITCPVVVFSLLNSPPMA
ncbi:MAG TPA: hypothetical protein VEL76_14400 [Gemmataceae bacterium]|nr:hypothetical protein [Gemmataceae bacterium]